MLDQFIANHWPLLLAITLWTLPWKGVALWKAAHNKDKWWFIIMLIANTVGILEITYIFYFSEKEKKSVTE